MRSQPFPPLVCPRCRRDLPVDGAEIRCAACAVDYEERDGILFLTLGRHGAPAFDPHYFATLAAIESRHFWFVSRRKLILDVLRRSVPDLAERRLFDVGCGSGGLLQFLAAGGVPLAGACDAYLESLTIVRRRVSAPLVLEDEGRLPPLGAGYSLVSMFDVLEHLDDDEGTLRFLFSVLEPGGLLVLTVPAHPFLFDEMDEIAHHRRRYRRAELRTKLLGAGFRIRRLTHFMAPLVLPLVALRGLGRLVGRRHGARERRHAEFRVVPVMNEALLALLSLERAFVRAASLPFGSSILALVERPS
jgi:SAM-dependent methyltransferase